MTSADLVTLGPNNAAEMVRPAAGLHRYNACPQLARKLDHSLAAHASPQHDGPAVVQRHDAAAFLPKSIPRTADFYCLSLRIGCPKTLCPKALRRGAHSIKACGRQSKNEPTRRERGDAGSESKACLTQPDLCFSTKPRLRPTWCASRPLSTWAVINRSYAARPLEDHHLRCRPAQARDGHP